MHALIIYAHPESQSFTAALRDQAVKTLEDADWTYDVSDLFAEGFNPVIGRHDFQDVKNPDYFSVQDEQTHAETLNDPENGAAGGCSPEILRELQRISRADLVLFVFPMWWGGTPAVIKGWFDRVMSYGFSYADGIRYGRDYFRGRNAMVCVSTGGTAQRYTDEAPYGEIWRVLWPLQHCGIKYMGYNLLDTFVAYGAARLDDEQRGDYLSQWNKHLLAAMETTAAEADPKSIQRGTVDVRPLAYTQATDPRAAGTAGTGTVAAMAEDQEPFEPALRELRGDRSPGQAGKPQQGRPRCRADGDPGIQPGWHAGVRLHTQGPGGQASLYRRQRKTYAPRIHANSLAPERSPWVSPREGSTVVSSARANRRSPEPPAQVTDPASHLRTRKSNRLDESPCGKRARVEKEPVWKSPYPAGSSLCY